MAEGFEVEFTRDFVKRSLPPGARRILEVGCGSGELAASLSRDGLGILAIDGDGESIAAARQLGIDARVATWPDFAGGVFDAVLFTRSLHHIHPLDRAVEKAAESLMEGGRIIVEDFAYQSVDEETLRWFMKEIDALDSDNLLVKQSHFLDAVRTKTDTLAAWRENHEADLHTSSKIFQAIEETFGEVTYEVVPYFFRYLAREIVPTADRNAILRAFAEREVELISKGEIIALGRRFVAERRAPNK
jgi:SAM-dependent methyltransferase